MKRREQERLTEDRRASIKLGSWMSLVAVILVMSPSVFRLITEPFHWGDAAMVTAGTALAALHIVRLARLKRMPQARR